MSNSVVERSKFKKVRHLVKKRGPKLKSQWDYYIVTKCLLVKKKKIKGFLNNFL